MFALLLNITKSPGCKFDFDTAVPFDACAPDDLLIVIPHCLYTYDVNPEQSKPVDGDEPPDTYLHPRYCFAHATIPLPDEPEFDDVVVFVLLSVFVVFSSFCEFLLPLSISSLLDVNYTFLSDKYLLATYPVFPFTFIFDHVPEVSTTVTFVFIFN